MNNLSLPSNLKSVIKRIAAEVIYRSGLGLRLHKGKVVILMYHRVLKDNDETINYIQPGMYVTESSFDKQMKFIHEAYQVISLQTLLDAWKSGGLDPNNKYCVVTFDDGWLDNYENAFPILRKYGIPATIFLATSFVGTNQWFWPDKISYLFQIRDKSELRELLKKSKESSQPDRVLETMVAILEDNFSLEKLALMDKVIEGVKRHADADIHSAIDSTLRSIGENTSLKRITLNWDEIKEMSKSGVSFGSHTCSHKLLIHMPADKIQVELKESIAAIKEKDVKYVPVFCYPNGYYNDMVQKIVEKSGCEAAVTTRFGVENASGLSRFNLYRIGIHNDISSHISLFSFHLSGLGRRVAVN